jgi:hypothetical protein
MPVTLVKVEAMSAKETSSVVILRLRPEDSEGLVKSQRA